MAIPAATLVVVRDRAAGAPELLMVERSAGMAFAGGALVFPGGRIDEADRALATEYPGEDSAARITAIRETLEETAIPVAIAPVPAPDLCRDLQRALLAGEDFGTLVKDRGLQLETDALTPLARWVPKFHAVRRFDTLFLIARAPDPPPEPHVAGGECAAAFWIGAAEALAREQSGGARLIFPTRCNLERLALNSSFEEIRADALTHPIEPITPWPERIDGEDLIRIPEGLGYPVTREKLEGLWRG